MSQRTGTMVSLEARSAEAEPASASEPLEEAVRIPCDATPMWGILTHPPAGTEVVPLAVLIVVGGPHGTGTLPGLWNDEASAVRAVVEYLAALGHRRIARVAGMPDLWHTVWRGEAFEAAARDLGLTPVGGTTDYTGEAGARLTRRLLASAEPPTAIVYDNDVMAVAGLAVATEMGVPVPERLSIVAWDDSVLCEHTFPSLTALSHDVIGFGANVGRRLFDTIDGQPAGAVLDSTPLLVARGSTGAMRRLN